jgi:hypothetical protein
LIRYLVKYLLEGDQSTNRPSCHQLPARYGRCLMVDLTIVIWNRAAGTSITTYRAVSTSIITNHVVDTPIIASHVVGMSIIPDGSIPSRSVGTSIASWISADGASGAPNSHHWVYMRWNA